MNKLTCLSLLAGILLSGSCAMAQEASPPAPLSLRECIDTAMRSQADVIIARNNVVAAKSRTTRANASYWPQLSIQNNAFTFGKSGVLSQSTTGTAFNVSQSIFDGGLREAGVREAKYGVTESSASLSRTTQTVAFSVTGAYYDVLRAKRLAEVADTSVKYTEELRKQVQARAKEGAAAKVDVLPVEAELANARVAQLAAKNQVRTAALQLQSAMGLMPAPSFDVEDVKTIAEPEVRALEAYMEDARAQAGHSGVQGEFGSRASRRHSREDQPLPPPGHIG